MARREYVPVFRLKIGRGEGLFVDVHGFTAAEMSVPLVEIAGARDYLQHLTVDQAEQLADGLKLAARVARGEAVAPSPLNEFLERRKA
jgi:hypothetical protein